MQDIEVRGIKDEEIGAAVALIKTGFESFIATGYSPEGVNEFLRFIQPEAMQLRLEAGNIMLVAYRKDRLIGVIEVRDGNHIALLFTAEEFHRHGIANRLLEKIINICRGKNGKIAEITVNSSPFAGKIYEKMGFVHKDSEQVNNGIRFIPMVKRI